MRPFEPFGIPLQGLHLIEANAGTGKTHSLTVIYLRLIVEAAMRVEQILVVTYTKAATAELRERIRDQLAILLRALTKGEAQDDFTREFLTRIDDREQARGRVNLALLSFDQARIFTIHGFCQRVLADNAFESGIPFQNEIVSDERELQQQVVDDYWHRAVEDQPSGLLDFLLQRGLDPEGMSQSLSGNLGKPYLEIRGGGEQIDLAPLEHQYHQDFRLAGEIWLEQKQTISEQLLGSQALNRNKYRKDHLLGWLAALELYLGDQPGPWFDALHKFTAATLAQSVKKGAVPPEHPFYDACGSLLQSREALLAGYEAARVNLLAGLYLFAEQELAERKLQLRQQSYDDLLLNLYQALEGAHGEALAGMVRRDYACALIDEFQDTDPLQYCIFHRLFISHASPLFLVGDPKQAIYSFRGADLFAYLRAREDAPEPYTLDRNWRSVPQIIEGVNQLFDQQGQGFLFSRIPFQPSRPAGLVEPSLTEPGSDPAPFRIGFIPGGLKVDAATELAVEWCADEIARLLRPDGEGGARLDDRALTGGDMAVLVRSHRQASRINAALAQRGIGSVQHSQESVFHSDEAEQLERVMRALAEPGRTHLLHAALATEMIGLKGDELDQFGPNEEPLEHYFEYFFETHRLWRQQGFMRAFRHLLRELEISARLLGLQGGERRLTNLLHLGELLHQYDREASPGMEALIKWFALRRSSVSTTEESHQLRLESDENLVQIVTIHKSKGLQYPVVFNPFAWSLGVQSINKGQSYRFHDPDKGDQAVLELGSADWEQNLVHAQRESMAESLRLLYVSLTRAQQRCYLLWGNVNNAGQSALGWLLHPPPDPAAPDALEQLKRVFKELGDDAMRGRLRQLVDQSAGGIELFDCTPAGAGTKVAGAGTTAEAPGLRERSFSRTLEKSPQITSFSALSSGYEGREREEWISESVTDPPSDQVSDGSIFGFPRGTDPGLSLHAIFEQLPFDHPDPTRLQAVVQGALESHGIDTGWSPVVAEMVERVLATELERESGLRLNAISNSERLVEMAYHHPIGSISAKGLGQVLRQQGFATDERRLAALGRLDFRQVQGYMKGYIDLVVNYQGRFYLLDYKSNWLGNRIEDYAQPQLENAIVREGYFLQYLLYTLALHRYLRQRIPDYDYDRHFGAVFYLFLRGMDPEWGDEYGVYRDRPEKSLIEALESYFGASG